MASLVTLVYASASSALLPKVIAGALHALRDGDAALSVLQFEPGSDYVAGDLRRFIAVHRPLGVILFGPKSDDPTLSEACRSAGCNYVCIAPNPVSEAKNLVCSNDRQGAMDAVKYLIALGHRRIGFIAGPEHWHEARERELGYMDGLAAEKLGGADLVTQGDGSYISGYEAGRLLLEVSPRPTAVIAASDEMALGMLAIARKAGVEIPHALSVIGFGGIPAAAMSPVTLTTMQLPLAEMAFAATIKLLDPAQAEVQPVEFFCKLVAQGSTAPLR